MGNKLLIWRENVQIDRYNKELSYLQILVNAHGIKWEAPFMDRIGERNITVVKEKTLEEKQRADQELFMKLSMLQKASERIEVQNG